MQAIILAAGMGKRLKELTSNNTKCMVKVNGITLIERTLTQLDQLNLSKIIIVVGYEGKKLIDYVGLLKINTEIIFVENDIYDKTNNIYSLALAKNFLLQDDTLLLESDLIFEPAVLKALVEDPRETLALVDKYESWMDGTCVELAEDDSIINFVPGKKFDYQRADHYYKTVNIYKFSKQFSTTHYVPFLDAYSKALGNNEYYEQVLRVIALLDDPEIKGKRLDGQVWYEIDDIQDLDIASSLFAANEKEKTHAIQKRFGGYWRYPKMLDFCYLVNPYFPPTQLREEMKASFDILLTEYPSGMNVNSLLVAKNFGLRQENVVVGNGAAELIKSLMGMLSGTIGFIRPTFEEYPNRYDNLKSIIYSPDNADFSYTADNLIGFYADKKISALILINPDNPSGNYIINKDVMRLAEWCIQNQIKLIVDESFIDFAEEETTLLDERILSKFPNLIVVKSISKSYGVPGIRLGILASGDENLISDIKKDVAIWNINSFGEFYLQIAEKYKKDYSESLICVKNAREKLINQLSEIPGIRIIPSQANFVMIELINGIMASELTDRLLGSYNILIKDLSHKIHYKGKQYLRIAVRNDLDNTLLINALRIELSDIN